VPPGTEVRIDLNGMGSDRLQLETGRRGRAVAGRLARMDVDSVAVVAAVQAIESQYRTGSVTEVAFPLSEVREVSVRRLSAARTGLLIGGGVAAVLATLRISGGGSEDGGEPPPPLFQFRLPFPLFR
jgi:hypothetical protein